MASIRSLEKALNNPNVRKFLDLLAYTEGTEGNGYYTAFGGGRLSHLNDHPRYLKTFKQTNGKKNKTSAAGRYQFLRPTWDGLVKQYGFKDFGPRSQDLGAVALLAQNGALPYLLKGDFNRAIAKSGHTWASLPTSPHPQPTKSWNKVRKFLGSYNPSAPQPTRAIQRPPTIKIDQLQAQIAAMKRPDTVPIEQLQQQALQPERPQEFARPKAVSIDQLLAQQQPDQSKQQGFGTYEAITNELPKLKEKGLNPWQSIYTLAQRQDMIGESIRTAYKDGVGPDKLAQIFGVNKIWQTQPQQSSDTLPPSASAGNQTIKSSLASPSSPAPLVKV